MTQRKQFEAEMSEFAKKKMEDNMQWGLERVREFGADVEKVIDQVYGFNQGVFAIMPESFFTESLDTWFTDKWNAWLKEIRA